MTHHRFSTDHDFDDFGPDGFTSEATTAPRREVDREGRREGDPVRDGHRPMTRRSSRAPVESGADWPAEPGGRPASVTTRTAPGSCASLLPGEQGQPGGTGAPDGVGPSTGEPAGDPVPTLFTPAQAADLLQVPESWLRRRAARRLVPCTFLGKHLRFSRANLDQILTDAARPATTSPRPPSGVSAAPRRRGRPPARARVEVRRPDSGKRTRSSGA
ncbi:helix-turn-helix domain-containing protein [Kutzneria sp. 744]|uniref:helix-turn-helix domain-containing protein n=1 Tax=Kutzneria sp. (strain 744) TaxID=345341 RepID=UPI0003EEC77B|nr:excisionase family DNA binding protein [Kutzneria sp. 744]